MENNTFKMTYSAEQREEIERIRKKYVPQEQDNMERLRALDAAATKRATTCSVTVGTVGALVMGCGMSMAMTDFGSFFGAYRFFVGVALGVLGIAVVAAAYPLYNRTLKKARKKIAPEILRLTEELMK